MIRIRAGLAVAVPFLAALPFLGCSSASDLKSWPSQLVAKSTTSQTGLVGFAVNAAPSVQLLGPNGEPIAGANVTFTGVPIPPEFGGGSNGKIEIMTDKDGIATLPNWTAAMGNNTITAALPGVFHVAPVTFDATGVAGAYHIDLDFLVPVSPSRQAVFDSAAARWERIVYNDLSDIPVNIPADFCFNGQPAFNSTIDDLWIFVVLDSIDGPGNILGGAGPCLIRSSNKLSLMGEMVFDTADVAFLEANGIFDEVILHEMGHVIGFGTLWDLVTPNLIVGPAATGGTDPHFIGVQAIDEFNKIGGTGYTAGAKVPVENTGGQGTADAHWRETTFGPELMTGFINVGVPNPLSVVSIASMGDMGYQVNYAAADPFTVSFAAAPPGAAPALFRTISLGNDILRRPIHLVDRQGRLVGLFKR